MLEGPGGTISRAGGRSSPTFSIMIVCLGANHIPVREAVATTAVRLPETTLPGIRSRSAGRDSLAKCEGWGQPPKWLSGGGKRLLKTGKTVLVDNFRGFSSSPVATRTPASCPCPEDKIGRA